MKKNRTKLSILLILLILSSNFIGLFLMGVTNLFKHQIGDYGRSVSGELKISAWNLTMMQVLSIESVNHSSYPEIAVDSSGNVHVVWEDNTNYKSSGTDTDIFYKFWNATTGTWNETEVLSTESTSFSEEPKIAVDDSGNVHVVWSDNTDYAGAGADYDIFYKYWNISTRIWSGHVNATDVVSNISGWSWRPDITVDSSGNVHVIWEDTADYLGAGNDADIFYKFWNASIETWTAIEVVSMESTDGSSRSSIAVDLAENIHVAWYDYTNYSSSGTDADIFYKFKNTTTKSWSGRVNQTDVVSTESTENSFRPSIAIDDTGNMHLVWEDNTDYGGSGIDRDIFYKQWNVTSNNWTITEVVSTGSTTGDFFPEIVLDSKGNVHLVWSGIDVNYRLWNMTTETWTITEIVSPSIMSPFLLYPAIAVDDSGNIHFVWQNNVDFGGAGPDLDIFYRAITEIPMLYPIIPNPDTDGIINLDWSDVVGAATYYIYRNNSVIISLGGLVPIANVSESNYTDTLSVNGTYYYVVVAGNSTWNSSPSNCENVTVTLPPLNLNPPVLDPIHPNPDTNGIIQLNWSEVGGATTYYLYRDTSIITSAVGLMPIAVVADGNYTDTIIIDGTYFYVVVAGNATENSSISNCENVTVWQLLPPAFIMIGNNLDFEDYTSQGNGSVGNPFILENFVINASSSNMNGISIQDTNSHFILMNCTVTEASSLFPRAGIRLFNVTNGKILNDTVNSNYIGIWLESSDKITLTNNTIKDNYIGISLESSSNITISNNTIDDNDYNGIWLELSSNNTLSNNTIRNYKDSQTNGIWLTSSGNNRVYNNKFHKDGIRLGGTSISDFIQEITADNMIDNRPIYYYKHQMGLSIPLNASQVILVNCSLFNVTNCNVSSGSAGVSLFFSNNNTISNNTANNNTWEGIYLQESSNNSLFNNTVNFNGWTGIILRDYCDHNKIINNTAENNFNGVYLDFFSDWNTLTNNSANNNTYYGIGLDLFLSNNRLDQNTANNNSYGIYMDACDNHTLTNNTANFNDFRGITLSLSSNNTLFNNSANQNQISGIYIDGLNNRLINNTVKNNVLRGIVLWTSSNNNTLLFNTVNNNTYGIYLWGLSNNNTLTGNEVNNNTIGIYLVGSNYNNVTGNILRDNDPLPGIYETDCYGNIIINNDCVPRELELNPISPTNNTDGQIALNWSEVSWATFYLVYRSSSPIIDVTGLTLVANVTVSNHTDTIMQNGTYYYVVIAANSSLNSSISNSENVTVAISSGPPSPPGWGLQDFLIILLFILSVLIGAISVSSVVLYTVRRRARAKGDELGFGKGKKFKQSPLDQKIQTAVEENILIEDFETSGDIDLMNLLTSEIGIITPSIKSRISNLPISDSEKEEILRELARMPTDLQEKILDQLENQGF